MDKKSWIPASWSAPANVIAGCTTRLGGYSQSPYASLNFGMHVGDDPEHVQNNRQMLQEYLQLPTTPDWLEQIHSCHVSTDAERLQQADAAITTHTGKVCVVMTADCLPLLVTDNRGTCVAAIHAGWRGLCNGIIAQTIKRIPVNADELLVWLGPAIGPRAFEVGDDVYEAFVQQTRKYHEVFTRAGEKWLMDVYHTARLQLQSLGVTRISGGDYCTYENETLFYSYRRDGQTGRMASLIWMT